MKIPSSKVKVDFFYDIISPYAWINFEAWLRYEKVWPIQLCLRPFYLPGVFKGAGNIPPISIPNKNAYLQHDIDRLNQYWGTNLVWRKDFASITLKSSSIGPQRMLAAVQLYEPEKLIPASRSFWERVWTNGKGVYTQGDVEEVANSLNLSNKEKILSSVQTDEVKNVIINNVKEALETESFGAPWVVLHLANGKKEAFFGADRMHLIAQTLGVPYLGPLKEMETIEKKN